MQDDDDYERRRREAARNCRDRRRISVVMVCLYVVLGVKHLSKKQPQSTDMLILAQNATNATKFASFHPSLSLDKNETIPKKSP